MFTHSKTRPNKSTHNSAQAFFGKGSAKKSNELFFTRISSSPAIQKKCVACDEEKRIQPKLTIGQPDDEYEREADAIADRIVGQSETNIQRQEVPEEEEEIQAKPLAGQSELRIQRQAVQEEEEEEIQTKPLSGESELLIQRQAEEENEEEETLQTKAQATARAEISRSTASNVRSIQGSGHKLSEPTRNFFESRFGRDFSDVRVHTDSRAAHLARSINARAFTMGSDVVFGSGEYSPSTVAGNKLLAHELTHVVQQSGNGDGVKRIQRWQLGGAPAPAGLVRVTDPRHIRRLNRAENIVRGVLTNRNCQNYFSSRCGTANALQDAFDNSNVYLRPLDDNVLGLRIGNNIAFNLRAFRIGRFMMAHALLHEMFHTCDPTPRTTQNQRELNSENAVETCRIHTPWIDEVTPRRASVGTRITIRGWGFGPTRSAVDEVRFGGISANIVSWTFMTDNSSRVEIVSEVPAGAGPGGITVINNRVTSNNALFTVV